MERTRVDTSTPSMLQIIDILTHWLSFASPGCCRVQLPSDGCSFELERSVTPPVLCTPDTDCLSECPPARSCHGHSTTSYAKPLPTPCSAHGLDQVLSSLGQLAAFRQCLQIRSQPPDSDINVYSICSPQRLHVLISGFADQQRDLACHRHQSVPLALRLGYKQLIS
jgi:hypothetical protein